MVDNNDHFPSHDFDVDKIVSTVVKSLLSNEEFVKNLVSSVVNDLKNTVKEAIVPLQDASKKQQVVMDNHEILIKRLETDVFQSKLLMKTLEININELKKLSSTVVNLNEKYNHIEQYSRRENIRIHNYPETKEEDVLGIVMGLANDMQVNINEYDISVCHRTGKSKDGKPRQLI
ncbi:unnamed protein product, partial [Didymodactylos carnosus]